ncbi:MAG: OmpA family protein [Ferruginibacter sp.]
MKYNYIKKLSSLGLIAISILSIQTLQAQTLKRVKPVWWLGESAGANFNKYRGTTQKLNNEFTTPTAFHKGEGYRPYASLLLEYRPGRIFGGMLNVAYDNRGGEFDEVQAPCDCPANLKTNLSYVTIEPSLRITPFSIPFYVFAGPVISFNVTNKFTYTQDKQNDVREDWSDMQKPVFSGQVGAGFDIPVSAKSNPTQFTISPFASFQTDLGRNPREIESWSIYTVRAGIALKFGTGKTTAPQVAPAPAVVVVPPVTDRDGDGILDVVDKCPDVPGFAKYQGCPVPDTDGDGINDELDKCPTVFGLARYQGCPIPDTDGDGINDEEDKCPTRQGPVSNKGCPVIAKEVIEKINFAAKNVFFATGSYKLLPKSFKSLDEVVKIMKADNSLIIDIDGHTDAQGSDESNQVLSDNRAGAVKNYLTEKGVDASSLKSSGFGETKPVADNKTAAGRAKNRRTEMSVRNY